MDVRTHLRVVWHYRFPIVAGSLVIAGVVYAVVASRADQYATEARLAVVDLAVAGDDTEALLLLAASYAELADTGPVLDDALEGSGLPFSVDQARRSISAEADDEVPLLTVRASAEDPVAAVDLGDAVVDALTSVAEERSQSELREVLEPLDARIDEIRDELVLFPPGSEEASIRLSELQALAASRAQLSAAPRPNLEVVEPAGGTVMQLSAGALGAGVTALLVALLLNAELAVAFHILCDRLLLDDPDGIATLTGLPILATVPSQRRASSADTYRELRTALLLRSGVADDRTTAVVGIGSARRISEVSVGLAEAVADLDVRVTLVDAGLRAPQLHQWFGLGREPGLGDLDEDDEGQAPEQIVRPLPDEPNLRIVTAGTPVDDPGRLITLRFPSFLQHLAGEQVVLNLPSTDQPAEATAAAALCNSSVLVVAAGARRSSTAALAADLRRLDASPVGVVVHGGSR